MLESFREESVREERPPTSELWTLPLQWLFVVLIKLVNIEVEINTEKTLKTLKFANFESSENFVISKHSNSFASSTISGLAKVASSF